jgi:hypothetical protein
MKAIPVKGMTYRQGKTLVKQCMQKSMLYYNALMPGL